MEGNTEGLISERRGIAIGRQSRFQAGVPAKARAEKWIVEIPDPRASDRSDEPGANSHGGEDDQTGKEENQEDEA